MKNNNTIIVILALIIIGFIAYSFYKKPVTTTPNVIVTPVTPAISGDTGNFVSFSIAPGATVSGTMTATGSVKGGYFFEANMGVKILDANKNVLKSTNGTATSDWMTSGPVSFTTNLDFTGIPAGQGFIRLHNDNPSGMPENDRFIDIPVVFK